MTPLERIVAEGIAAWRERDWYEHSAYEQRAKREIKEMAEVIRRSVGQKLRYMRQRLKGA